MPVRPKTKQNSRKPIRGAASGVGNPDGRKVRSDKGKPAPQRASGKGSSPELGREPNTDPSQFGPERGRGEREPEPPSGPPEPTTYQCGFDDGEWQDAGVRGRVFVCGLPNSGKSWQLVNRVRAGRRVIVYNPANADTIYELLQDGFVPVSQPQELRDGLARSWGVDFRFLYTPQGGEMVQHFEAVNKLVAKCGQLLYAVDEVDKHQEPGFAPPNFYDLINYGRHYKVAQIGTARRPAQVSKDYTYCLSEIVAFNFREPGDVKYFESKCGRRAGTILPRLGKYEYLRWIQDGRISTGKGW